MNEMKNETKENDANIYEGTSNLIATILQTFLSYIN